MQKFWSILFGGTMTASLLLFIVSPFVEPGTVFSEPLDHTSVLGFLAERFTPGQPYSDEVARRLPTRLADALTRSEPRQDLQPPPQTARVVLPSTPILPAGLADRAEEDTENVRAFRAAAETTVTEQPLAAIKLLPQIGHFIVPEAP